MRQGLRFGFLTVSLFALTLIVAVPQAHAFDRTAYTGTVTLREPVLAPATNYTRGTTATLTGTSSGSTGGGTTAPVQTTTSTELTTVSGGATSNITLRKGNNIGLKPPAFLMPSGGARFNFTRQ